MNTTFLVSKHYVFVSVYSRYSLSTFSETTLALSFLSSSWSLASGYMSAKQASPPIVSQASAGNTLKNREPERTQELSVTTLETTPLIFSHWACNYYLVELLFLPVHPKRKTLHSRKKKLDERRGLTNLKNCNRLRECRRHRQLL